MADLPRQLGRQVITVPKRERPLPRDLFFDIAGPMRFGREIVGKRILVPDEHLWPCKPQTSRNPKPPVWDRTDGKLSIPGGWPAVLCVRCVPFITIPGAPITLPVSPCHPLSPLVTNCALVDWKAETGDSRPTIPSERFHDSTLQFINIYKQL